MEYSHSYQIDQSVPERCLLIDAHGAGVCFWYHEQWGCIAPPEFNCSQFLTKQTNIQGEQNHA